MRRPRGLRVLHAARTGRPAGGAEGAIGVRRERFVQLVEEALQEIPRRFRDAMANVAVVVEEEPPSHVLDDMDIGPDDTLFGLYQGTPLPERGWGYGNTLPDRISIYQFPIEDACADEDEIRDCVAETVIHEFGHYFGMSEEEIEEIEEKFWRGENLDDV
jgi:predicted Zn-dependent protease with MMP-like domain